MCEYNKKQPQLVSTLLKGLIRWLLNSTYIHYIVERLEKPPTYIEDDEVEILLYSGEYNKKQPQLVSTLLKGLIRWLLNSTYIHYIVERLEKPPTYIEDDEVEILLYSGEYNKKQPQLVSTLLKGLIRWLLNSTYIHYIVERLEKPPTYIEDDEVEILLYSGEYNKKQPQLVSTLLKGLIRWLLNSTYIHYIVERLEKPPTYIEDDEVEILLYSGEYNKKQPQLVSTLLKGLIRWLLNSTYIHYIVERLEKPPTYIEDDEVEILLYSGEYNKKQPQLVSTLLKGLIRWLLNSTYIHYIVERLEKPPTYIEDDEVEILLYSGEYNKKQPQLVSTLLKGLIRWLLNSTYIHYIVERLEKPPTYIEDDEVEILLYSGEYNKKQPQLVSTLLKGLIRWLLNSTYIHYIVERLEKPPTYIEDDEVEILLYSGEYNKKQPQLVSTLLKGLIRWLLNSTYIHYIVERLEKPPTYIEDDEVEILLYSGEYNKKQPQLVSTLLKGLIRWLLNSTYIHYIVERLEKPPTYIEDDEVEILLYSGEYNKKQPQLVSTLLKGLIRWLLNSTYIHYIVERLEKPPTYIEDDEVEILLYSGEYNKKQPQLVSTLLKGLIRWLLNSTYIHYIVERLEKPPTYIEDDEVEILLYSGEYNKKQPQLVSTLLKGLIRWLLNSTYIHYIVERLEKPPTYIEDDEVEILLYSGEYNKKQPQLVSTLLKGLIRWLLNSTYIHYIVERLEKPPTYIEDDEVEILLYSGEYNKKQPQLVSTLLKGLIRWLLNSTYIHYIVERLEKPPTYIEDDEVEILLYSGEYNKKQPQLVSTLLKGLIRWLLNSTYIHYIVERLEKPPTYIEDDEVEILLYSGEYNKKQPQLVSTLLKGLIRWLLNSTYIHYIVERLEKPPTYIEDDEVEILLYSGEYNKKQPQLVSTLLKGLIRWLLNSTYIHYIVERLEKPPTYIEDDEVEILLYSGEYNKKQPQLVSTLLKGLIRWLLNSTYIHYIVERLEKPPTYIEDDEVEILLYSGEYNKKQPQLVSTLLKGLIRWLLNSTYIHYIVERLEKPPTYIEDDEVEILLYSGEYNKKQPQLVSTLLKGLIRWAFKFYIYPLYSRKVRETSNIHRRRRSRNSFIQW